MKNIRLLLGAVIVVVIAVAVYSGVGSGTVKAQESPAVAFEFSVTFDGVRSADEVTNLIVANIGSSGEDGVRLGDFNVDSFFDIEYRIEFDKKGNPESSTVDIELVALSLKSSPASVIDNVGAVLSESGKVKEYYGHVTLLR